MCNYGGQAFDPAFPSGLNCPHIERCSVSLGTPLYSAALSCAPLWNSKHPFLKSELWPVHAPVRRWWWWWGGPSIYVCVWQKKKQVKLVCVDIKMLVFMVMLAGLEFHILWMWSVCDRKFVFMHSCVCVWVCDCDSFHMLPCVICPPHNNYHLCQINQRDFLFSSRQWPQLLLSLAYPSSGLCTSLKISLTA